jgi:hypothetical protein
MLLEMILRFVIETLYALGTIPVISCLLLTLCIGMMVDSPNSCIAAIVLVIIGLASRYTKCFGMNA